MNRNTLKNYAPQARRNFITAVTDRAAYYGLTRDKIETITAQGDVVLIAGKPFPRHIGAKRKRLEERIIHQGFEQTMEAMAYTWFNRFAAIRFMELHGYLEHGYRVLSHPDPEKTTPEILEHAEHVELPGLEVDEVVTAFEAVELLQHDDRERDVVLLEGIDAGVIEEDHVRVDHEELLHLSSLALSGWMGGGGVRRGAVAMRRRIRSRQP